MNTDEPTRIEEGYLTVEEAADLLRVKPRWVYDACRRGALPYTKVGHFLRFRKTALEEWLREQES